MVSFRENSQNIQLLFGAQIPRCFFSYSRFKLTRFNVSKAEIGSRRQDGCSLSTVYNKSII